jgi:2',3'-cyclic-nucleotide 2'-phosphodiesterase (5'-nucleotidase family)
VLVPYRVVTLGTLRVGIFACTTNRGPTIVGSKVTQGVTFTDCKNGMTFNAGTPDEKVVPPEIPTYVDILRNQENVDLVVMLSEAGLAENIYNAENFSGIDIIFSSDQHEETNIPVIATTPDGGFTFIVEEGEDGAQVGELTVTIVDKKIVSLAWKGHDIDDTVAANPWLTSVIEKVSAPFRSGPEFVPGQFVNPYNGAKLNLPIDSIIGYTEVPLTRNAYSYEYFPVTDKTPAIIEGSSHDFLADAFRVITGAQIGAIRGFRYVNDIPPGPITYEDIYSLIPIGPQIAVGTITAAALNNQAENAADSVLNPDVTQWRGGWMFNFSDVTFDLLPYESRVLVGGTNPPENQLDQGRIANIQVGGSAVTDATQTLTYASYFYSNDPDFVNAIGAKDISVFTKDGLLPAASVTPDNVMDATEVVRMYLATFPNNTLTASSFVFPRINITEPLPDSTAEFGFPVIEPLRGAVRPVP